jgi:hypothetical protein
MSAAPWKLDGHLVHLSSEGLRATLDLREPESGLQELQLGLHSVRGHVLGVLLKPHVENKPADAYVRVADLVATYAETSARAMRVQVYWHCESRVSRHALELQVSVQTDQLGIATPVITCSQLPAVEALRLIDADSARCAPLALRADEAQQLFPREGPGCLLFRLPDSSWTYAEMIHAADFQQDQFVAQQTSDGNCHVTLEHRLFPDTLEKGVILRARIRGMFLPREDDVAHVAEDYLHFLRSPLPLTT